MSENFGGPCCGSGTDKDEHIAQRRLRNHTHLVVYETTVKADMKSYIPLETAAIFFLANLFLKQGISSEYVMVDFICIGKLGQQGAKTENNKMKNSCP